MDTLNEYLKNLLSSCSDELRLEPDKKPYLVKQDDTTDLAHTPLMGTQISTLVFPLIPAAVKSSLPQSNEVEFVHPHALGNFNFTVQKSPGGFIVTIRPLLSDSNGSIKASEPLPEVAPSYTAELGTPYQAAPEPVPPPAEMYSAPIGEYKLEAAGEYEPESVAAGSFDLESSSMTHDLTSSAPVDAAPIADVVYDETPYEPEYATTGAGGPDVEIVSVNDPQFQTVFSDTSAYEPPGKRADLMAGEYVQPMDGIGIEPASFSDASEMQAQQSSFEQPSTYSSPPHEPNMHQNTIVEPPPSYSTPTAPATSAFVPAAANAGLAGKMDELFRKMAEIGASDLHLSVSMPPMIRKDGKMAQLQAGDPAMTREATRDLLTSIMPARNQEEFAARSDTDFAYEIPDLARFRCNVFMDRKGMGGVFRIIPTKILTAEQLGLSKAIMDLCSLSKGLVVVTGPTGSGKSTTLCAMVDSINKNREDHIITIEDPIEFTHENQKCLVNQREVHNHTDSFKDALRAALREDPDILLVGEMRDLETISIAIETAETGHLVFGTLHTTTAPSTVDRIIDQFPADRQQQIRVMLSESLKGVIAQTLLPKKGGGRVAALEVLIITPAISNLIREGKTFQIPSAMQTGKVHGMVMLNEALFEHVQNGTVEPRDAYIKAVDKTNFETMLTRGGFKL
jgi:twitching motility protein PilT